MVQARAPLLLVTVAAHLAAPQAAFMVAVLFHRGKFFFPLSQVLTFVKGREIRETETGRREEVGWLKKNLLPAKPDLNADSIQDTFFSLINK